MYVILQKKIVLLRYIINKIYNHVNECKITFQNK